MQGRDVTHANPARLCMLRTRLVRDRFYPSSEDNGFASGKGHWSGPEVLLCCLCDVGRGVAPLRAQRSLWTVDFDKGLVSSPHCLCLVLWGFSHLKR